MKELKDRDLAKVGLKPRSVIVCVIVCVLPMSLPLHILPSCCVITITLPSCKGSVFFFYRNG